MVNVDIRELKMMVREFWAVANNSNCLKHTLIFLQRQGCKQEIKELEDPIKQEMKEQVDKNYSLSKKGEKNDN